MTASLRNDVGPVDVNDPMIFVPSSPWPTNVPEAPVAVSSPLKLPAHVPVVVVSVNVPNSSPLPVVRSRLRFTTSWIVPVRSPATTVVCGWPRTCRIWSSLVQTRPGAPVLTTVSVNVTDVFVAATAEPANAARAQPSARQSRASLPIPSPFRSSLAASLPCEQTRIKTTMTGAWPDGRPRPDQRLAQAARHSPMYRAGGEDADCGRRLSSPSVCEP